jgi:hypothetical protein
VRPGSYLMTIRSYRLSLPSSFCTQKMETAQSLETFVNSYKNEQHHIPEDSFVYIVTVLHKESRRFGVRFLDGARNLSFLFRRLDRIWIPPRPLCGGYSGSFPSQNGCCVKSTAALLSTYQIDNAWRYTSNLAFILKSRCLVKLKDKLLFTLAVTSRNILTWICLT